MIRSRYLTLHRWRAVRWDKRRWPNRDVADSAFSFIYLIDYFFHIGRSFSDDVGEVDGQGYMDGQGVIGKRNNVVTLILFAFGLTQVFTA